jgi:predicted nuclease of restriction endonuclease-like (RecB) superfamily
MNMGYRKKVRPQWSRNILRLHSTLVCLNIGCKETARPRWSRKILRLYKTHWYARTLIVEKPLVHGGAAKHCVSTKHNGMPEH